MQGRCKSLKADRALKRFPSHSWLPAAFLKQHTNLLIFIHRHACTVTDDRFVKTAAVLYRSLHPVPWRSASEDPDKLICSVVMRRNRLPQTKPGVAHLFPLWITEETTVAVIDKSVERKAKDSPQHGWFAKQIPYDEVWSFYCRILVLWLYFEFSWFKVQQKKKQKHRAKWKNDVTHYTTKSTRRTIQLKLLCRTFAIYSVIAVKYIATQTRELEKNRKETTISKHRSMYKSKASLMWLRLHCDIMEMVMVGTIRCRDIFKQIFFENSNDAAVHFGSVSFWKRETDGLNARAQSKTPQTHIEKLG